MLLTFRHSRAFMSIGSICLSTRLQLMRLMASSPANGAATATMDNNISTPITVAAAHRTWRYAGSFFSQLAQNMTRYSTCLPPPSLRDQAPDEGGDVPSGTKGYGGHCDQFGKDCRMWECPDLFQAAPGITAFK